MTVQSTQSTVSYTPTGVNEETFTVPFRYDLATDIKVVVIDVNGVQTQQVLNTDYTITAPGNSGTVTWIGMSPDATNTVSLTRFVDLTQLTDFPSNGPLPAEDIEDSLDKLTFITQELSERTGGTGFIAGRKVMGTNPVDLSEWDGENLRIGQVKNPVDDQDVATKTFVNGQIAGQGNVPPPIDVVEDDFVLAATGGGAFDWRNVAVPTPGATDRALLSTGPADGDYAFFDTEADNYLINSEFAVAQRETTFSPLASGAQYTLDRWIVIDENGGGNASRLAVTAAKGSGASHGINIKDTTLKWGLLQWIEFSTVQAIIDGKVSISFKGKSITTSQNVRIAVLEWDGTADQPPLDPVLSWNADGIDPTFKTDVTAVSITTIAVPTLLFQLGKIEGVTLDAVNANNIGFFIYSENQGAPDIEITACQLTVGDRAYPFKPTGFGAELLLCKRYFAKTYSHDVVPGTVDMTNMTGALFTIGQSVGGPNDGRTVLRWQFEVEMRREIGAAVDPAILLTFNPAIASNVNWRNFTDGNNEAFNAADHESTTAVVLSATTDSLNADDDMFIHATVDAELGVP